MATAEDVLNIARGELGYDRYQDAQQGTKYGRWYASKTGSSYFGTTGVPYCAMFASWCLDQAGVSCSGMPNASTTAIKNSSGSAKRSNPRNAQPGDVILISWSCDDNDLDHTCLCEANCGSYIQTIEGNVNNGKVERRTRDWSYIRYAVVPNYDAASDEPTPVTPSSSTGSHLNPAADPLLLDGDFGTLTVKYIQMRLRSAGWYPAGKYVIDGDFGYYTKFYLQKYLRYNCGTYDRNCDGDFGSYSVKALQQHLLNAGCYWDENGDCIVDGDWGSLTTVAIQRAIDAGVF
jgi:hypothetical protein